MYHSPEDLGFHVQRRQMSNFLRCLCYRLKKSLFHCSLSKNIFKGFLKFVGMPAILANKVEPFKLTDDSGKIWLKLAKKFQGRYCF